MTTIYFAVHGDFEDTNAIFLSEEKCKDFVRDKISMGYGKIEEWGVYEWKIGKQFNADIYHFPKSESLI